MIRGKMKSSVPIIFKVQELADLRSNQIQIRQTASEYRYHRLQELLGAVKKNTVSKTAQILRDRDGLGKYGYRTG